jgi:hypothetical protein
MIILVQPVCVGRRSRFVGCVVVVALERSSLFGTVVALSSALLVGKAR